MKITVRKKQKEFSFSSREGEKILYAGLRNGISLSYECATGTCGTCKARLDTGELIDLWPDAPGAATLKTERNEFLMCQSAAATDCEISVRTKLVEADDSSCVPDSFAGKIVLSEHLTHDVIRFDVDLERPMRFKAGQFSVISVPGVTGGRAYSMVNYEKQTSRLEFIIKRLNDGAFSKWMFEKRPENTEIELFGPLGTATLDPGEGKHVLCITGGSGIAGIMSLLHQGIATEYFLDRTGHVFFGVRSEQDLFFLDRLENLIAQAQGNLNVTIALSHGELPSLAARNSENISFTRGFVTPVAMEKMQNRFDDTVAFVAGPPPMVDDALRQLILEAGLPGTDVRYDKFS